MPDEIVSLFTAPQLNYRRLFELKIQIAKDEAVRKSVEVFSETFDRSKSHVPSGEAGLRKAILLHIKGDSASAEEALKSEKGGGALLYRVLSLIALENRTQAVKLLADLKKAALSAGDQGLIIQATLAALELRQKEVAADLAAKVDGPSAGPYAAFIKAFILTLEHRYEEAEERFAALAESDHAVAGLALFHQALLLDMWGHDDEALEVYRKIEQLGYTFEEALVNQGILLDDRQDFVGAMRCYEKALKVSPTNARARLYHSDAEACLNMVYDERKLKQDIRTSEILSIPISDFELSVRSRNCLSKMGIFTLRDLITKTEQELLGYKNFGETSLKEIRAMLAKKGLHLGMTRVDEQPLADRIKMNTQLMNLDSNYTMQQLDISLEDLNLSYRTKSALHKMGFESLRDITMRTGRDLESNPDFSPACLQEVNALLEERGLSYRPETSTSREYEGGSSLLDGDAVEGEETVLPEGGEKTEEPYDDV